MWGINKKKKETKKKVTKKKSTRSISVTEEPRLSVFEWSQKCRTSYAC